MKLLLSTVPLLLCGGLAMTAPVGSAFSYHGLLHNNGAPANGTFDLQFRLFDDPSVGSPVGSPPVLTLEDVAVNNGLFTVTLDFGAAVFNGSARFLEISVRAGADTGSFTTLPARQPVLPTPEAVHAAKADTANSVASGAIGTAQLADGSVTPAKLSTTDVVLSRLSAPDGSPLNAVQVDNVGNVGIGTVNPQAKLHVNSGGIFSSEDSDEGGSLTLKNPRKTNGAADRWTLYNMTGGYGDSFQIYNYPEGSFPCCIQRFVIKDDGTTILAPSGGNVGIGTDQVGKTLEVVGNLVSRSSSSAGGTAVDLVAEGGGLASLWTNPSYNPANPGSGWRRTINMLNGNVGIGTTTPQAKLDINGTFAANVVTVKGADISEPFDIDAAGGALEPGMVACIDPANPGKLVLSSKAHDRTVAGIISGAGGVNTGMLMSAPGTRADGKHPVALTGRVYAWTDASSGPIQPGDLLTTSDMPGHAMRVTDHSAAQGAIIGKAMTALAEGKGLVLVLVSLQ